MPRAKLDDPDLRQALIAAIIETGEILPACRAVGIGRTSLQRYFEKHVEFRAEVDAACGLPRLSKRTAPIRPLPRVAAPPAPKAKPPAIEAEVVELATRRPEPPLVPQGPEWFRHLDGVMEECARTWRDKTELPALRAIAMRAIFANVDKRTPVEASTESIVEVEVGPEQPPREIAEGDWRGS